MDILLYQWIAASIAMYGCQLHKYYTYHKDKRYFIPLYGFYVAILEIKNVFKKKN